MKSEKEFLEKYDISSYDRPSVTVDIALFALHRDAADIHSIDVKGLEILLIRRANHPYKDKWALPGGFYGREDETLEDAALRELCEETGISDAYISLATTSSKNGRDPRGWIISNTYLSIVDKNSVTLRADTDAWEARWFLIKDLTSRKISDGLYQHKLVLEDTDSAEKLVATCEEQITENETFSRSNYKTSEDELAFDHGMIIIKTLRMLRAKVGDEATMIFHFFPEKFSVGEVRAAYEAITGTKTMNYRRSIEKYIEETDEIIKGKGYKPAKLYRRRQYVTR